MFQNGPVYRWHLNGVDRWRWKSLDLVAVFKFYPYSNTSTKTATIYCCKLGDWVFTRSPWLWLASHVDVLRGSSRVSAWKAKPHSHRLLVFTISSTKEQKSRYWLSTCILAYWLRNVLFSPGPVAVVVLSLFTSGAWDNIITFRHHPNVSFAPSFLHFCPDFHPPSYSLTPPMKCFQVSRTNFSLIHHAHDPFITLRKHLLPKWLPYYRKLTLHEIKVLEINAT